MSTAHAEAIGMAIFTAFFLGLAALAFRTQRRTGYKSQWRYVALIAAAIGIILLILNLNGYVFGGMGSGHGG
jgi:cbb3-type cytochrome oxidase subunit 3